MSLDLKEFLQSELIFFPFLLSKEEDVYMETRRLYPFLVPKDQTLVYILQKLLSLDSISFNFDNSRIYFSVEFLEAHHAKSGAMLEKTVYFQNDVPEITDFQSIHKYKNYGFIVFKTVESKLEYLKGNHGFLDFPEYVQRISEFRNLQLKFRDIPVDYSGNVLEFKNINPKTSFRNVQKIFSIVAPVEFLEIYSCGTSGIVSFKSEFGKKLALEYFTKEFIWQKDSKDLGSLLSCQENKSLVKRITLKNVQDIHLPNHQNLKRKRLLEETLEYLELSDARNVCEALKVSKSNKYGKLEVVELLLSDPLVGPSAQRIEALHSKHKNHQNWRDKGCKLGRFSQIVSWSSTNMKNIIAVIGPTGVGKSKLAIELAQRFKGEIVNADSMQVYKGLNIITNKVSQEEMCGIRHCLMDAVDPLADLYSSFTVQDWVDSADRAIKDIQDRGKVVILVGGTHYYLQSILTSHLINLKATEQQSATVHSQQMMKKVQDILQKSKLEPNKYAQELWDMIKVIDPVMGNRWHPRDGRKIRRSLEVFYTTGMRQSDIIKEQKSDIDLRYRTCIVWPFVEKDILEKRLDERIDEMIKMGLVEEIERFYNSVKEQGVDMDFTRGIFQAIGFKEFQDFLNTKNKNDLEHGVELMKLHTKQYAKRQITWIKNKLIGRLKDKISFVSFDVTDLNKWEENSFKFTEKVQDFLDGKQVHEWPQRFDSDSKPLNVNITEWKQFECNVCQDRVTKMPRILNGQHEWMSHINSRIHKRNERHKTHSTADLLRDHVISAGKN